MTRRLPGLVLLAMLLALAGTAVWRSAHQPHGDRVAQVAAQLRCPACDGETVAQSRSPVAAAMRATIAQQLAAGRTPAQVRSWFVARYGPGVLTEPPARGVGVLLWALPAAALAGGGFLVVRAARRRRRRTAAAETVRRPPGYVWDLVAVAVIGMVAAVAVTAYATTPDRTASRPGATPSSDPVTARLALGQSLEQQGQFAAAADVYRDVLGQHPDDQVRLKLAFALIRAGQPQEAADTARQVLTTSPDEPDALLMLGLAQRATKSPDAVATLRHFLDVAPQNPAAPEVRRLLAQP
jgi:cytochrome c-type biogenesis protein CcmH/NrfF/Tfp pilus assembly protein PilF